MNQTPQFLTLPDRKLAYQLINAPRGASGGEPSQMGQGSGLVFLGGFASDMTGTKAGFLAESCREAGRSCLLFDYRGHGASSGRFEEGCIGDWFDDALKVLDELTKGPQILVGSSMGGWIALLLARARPARLAGLVGIAAAPDFTEDLIRPTMTPQQEQQMETQGYFYERESHDVPDGEGRLPITKKLMEDGARQMVLRAPLAISAPVRLLQGQRDAEVPWETALKTAAHIDGDDVAVTLVKDADHRLSRPQDLALLWRTVEPLLG